LEQQEKSGSAESSGEQNNDFGSKVVFSCMLLSFPNWGNRKNFGTHILTPIYKLPGSVSFRAERSFAPYAANDAARREPRPTAVNIFISFLFPAPTGRHNIAQGVALGYDVTPRWG